MFEPGNKSSTFYTRSRCTIYHISHTHTHAHTIGNDDMLEKRSTIARYKPYKEQSWVDKYQQTYELISRWEYKMSERGWVLFFGGRGQENTAQVALVVPSYCYQYCYMLLPVCWFCLFTGIHIGLSLNYTNNEMLLFYNPPTVHLKDNMDKKPRQVLL